MELSIEEIQTKFNEVILYSQNYDEVNTDKLFEKWYASKKWFLDLNDGNPIYEVPEKVSFEIDDGERERRVINFVEQVQYLNHDLARFISYNLRNFYDNITVEEYKRDGFKVPKGMKISRAFKLFEKDKELLYKWQTIMSMMLQENKVEGTLCFSVHPLDFLSSSENTYNWRSCHSLDGEYRSGNLSYMLDKSTVICYLKGDKDTILPHFPSEIPWNNKKWRMLLFFSDQKTALFAGRQYPFFNLGILDVIKNKLCEAGFIINRGWVDWTNTEIKTVNYGTDEDGDDRTAWLNCTYIPMRYEIYKADELIEDAENSLHFNDLLRSSCYTPYYTWTDFPSWKHTKDHFMIGAEVPCLYCGQDHINITGSFMCDEHELLYGTYEDEDMFCYCDKCGERMYVDDDNTYKLRDGEYVCSDCLENYCTYCERCGEYVWNSQRCYDAEKDRYVCNECY